MKIPFLSQRQNQPAPPEPKAQSPVDIILHYHERTKHHYHQFAVSLGYLDWANQPNPFRRFKNAPFIRLPLLSQPEEPAYEDIFDSQKISPAPFDLNSISVFFRNSLAISAWKQFQTSRWALRVNPSSGNLHPTEAYLITDGKLPGIGAGVYHYAPREHGLEQRAAFVSQFIHLNFPQPFFLVALTTIYWREAWKYGERAFRYCQHDTGHALGALRISGALLGWKVKLIEEMADDEIGRLIGLNRASDFEEAEDENPQLLAIVYPNNLSLPDDFSVAESQVESAAWFGSANRLSESHMEWEIIDYASKSSSKPRTAPGARQDPQRIGTPVISTRSGPSAAQIIQQRRSCLDLDGVTSISRNDFYGMLMRTIPVLNPMPFDVLGRSISGTPRVHLAIFVHRVETLPPGLYFLVRNSDRQNTLRAAFHQRFEWQRPEGCPEDLMLFRLESGDFTRIAASVSCGQAIGGDGAFSLAMIAEFQPTIRTYGAWAYPRLFWECGLIGQVLYLEAEAAGIRSTGIGCYFDDPMHELLGIKNTEFQDLYHFTVGAPVEDERLTTDPPYPETNTRE